MRRLLLILVIAGVALVLLILIGGSLPPGNPIRDASDALRDLGSSISDGFGGGYGGVPSG